MQTFIHDVQASIINGTQAYFEIVTEDGRRFGLDVNLYDDNGEKLGFWSRFNVPKESTALVAAHHYDDVEALLRPLPVVKSRPASAVYARRANAATAMHHRLISKTASTSVIRFGLEYSLEVRRGARPVKRFFERPNNPRFEDSLLTVKARIRSLRFR